MSCVNRPFDEDRLMEAVLDIGDLLEPVNSAAVQHRVVRNLCIPDTKLNDSFCMAAISPLHRRTSVSRDKMPQFLHMRSKGYG